MTYNAPRDEAPRRPGPAGASVSLGLRRRARDPFLDNSLAYTNPSKDLKQYTKFILEPVVVHFAPDADGTAIDPGDLKMLADYWRDEAVKACPGTTRS